MEIKVNILNKLGCSLSLILIPGFVKSSNYPSQSDIYIFEFFTAFLVSVLIYVTIGLILKCVNKLEQLYMIPVFIILMASGALTMVQAAVFLLLAHYPGSLLLGSLSSTAIYLWYVKRQLKNISQESGKSKKD